MRSFIDIYIPVPIWPCFRNLQNRTYFLVKTDSLNLVSSTFSKNKAFLVRVSLFFQRAVE